MKSFEIITDTAAAEKQNTIVVCRKTNLSMAVYTEKLFFQETDLFIEVKFDASSPGKNILYFLILNTKEDEDINSYLNFDQFIQGINFYITSKFGAGVIYNAYVYAITFTRFLTNRV
jgi:hypothetical protein